MGSGISSENSTSNQDDIQASLQLAPLHCLGLEQDLSNESNNVDVNFEQFQITSHLAPRTRLVPIRSGARFLFPSVSDGSSARKHLFSLSERIDQSEKSPSGLDLPLPLP
jgi:hypothetical protein